MKKNGFTLIEILVVISIVVIIMGSITGIMSGVFTSQNKNNALSKITQSGEWISNELKKNFLNAINNGENSPSGNFYCSMGNPSSSIMIKNIKDVDKQKTTISCLGNAIDGYKIASISGKSVGTTVFLFQGNNDLKMSGCSVVCSTLPSLELSNVKFNFTLSAGSEGLSSGTTKAFVVNVTLRN